MKYVKVFVLRIMFSEKGVTVSLNCLLKIKDHVDYIKDFPDFHNYILTWSEYVKYDTCY